MRCVRGNARLVILLMFSLFLSSKGAAVGRVGGAAMRNAPLRLSSASFSSSRGHLAVHVRGKLTPDTHAAFFSQTLNNARNSVLERGISRFDVLSGENNEFLLIEVYNEEQGPAAHKETSHYNKWREVVAPFMAVPREATKYKTLFPPRPDWTTPVAASNIGEEEGYLQKYLGVDGKFPTGQERDRFHPSMLAVVVDVQVLAGQEESFIAATLDNCRASLQEPGVHRFDFLRNTEDPSNFALVEVYNDIDAPSRHKASSHYVAWANVANQIMARPRSAKKFWSVFPAPLFWHGSAACTHFGAGGAGGWGTVAGQGVPPQFSFQAPKLIVGPGVAAKEITDNLKALGIQKPMLVTGKSGMKRHTEIISSLCLAEEIVSYAVGAEPTVEDASTATAIAKGAGCDGVLSIGGGSAIDLGKVVAALVTNLGEPLPGSSEPSTVYSYLEVVGDSKPLVHKPLQHVAVPTTSGTGAECTKNSVLKSVKHGRKASIRHELMLPSVAIVDPMLSASCPSDITAHVGMDALCQCIEPFVSINANPIVDSLAREGILRGARSIRSAVADGAVDLKAREDMAMVSVLGGLSLANAKLGAVHGFASVLGGLYEIAPHGAICAALLPATFRKNFEKLESLLEVETDSDKADALSRKLGRFVEVACILTGNPMAQAEDGALWLEALVRDLEVPGLCSLLGEPSGAFSKERISEIITATAAASSTKGNPVVLTNEELTGILLEAA